MITVTAKGLNELKGKFATLSKDLQKELNAVVERGAQTFVRNAKRDCARNSGNTANRITYFPKAPLNFNVVSPGVASPYLEWGTITHVSVPGELSDYAIQFKGRGLKKNGGIHPHPFFFKQSGPVAVQLEKDIQAVLNDVKL